MLEKIKAMSDIKEGNVEKFLFEFQALLINLSINALGSKDLWSELINFYENNLI